MISASGSIQWRCGVCNAAKPVGTGGICSRCRKFACNRHLDSVITDGGRMKICSACLTAEDRVQTGLRDRLRKLLG